MRRGRVHYPQGENTVGDFRVYTAPNTGALLTISGRSYAVYMGRAPRDLPSVDVIVSMANIVAAGVVWAEMAVCSGAYVPRDGQLAPQPALTTLAFADCSADIVLANRTIVKTLNAAIPAGTELWAVFANAAATPATLRSEPGGDLLGGAAIAAARPSTMAAGQLFEGGNISAGAVSYPLMALHIP
jgi:hypothetical protein